jgi:hypothetical protein
VATVGQTGLVVATGNGTATISASYQSLQGTRGITVDVPLSITTGSSSFNVTHFATFYRSSGTIEVTLSRAASSPVPSRIRAEWENTQIGGTTNYSAGQTQLHIDFNQDTVSCPNFSNVPGDFLRLIDVDRQVTLARTTWTHTGSVTTLCK